MLPQLRRNPMLIFAHRGGKSKQSSLRFAIFGTGLSRERQDVHTLSGANLGSVEPSRVEIALGGGFRLLLHFLSSHLARLLIVPPQGLRCPRTWSLSPELAGCDPIDGRARLDLTGFPGAKIETIAE